jgi:hypothetical protein
MRKHRKQLFANITTKQLEGIGIIEIILILVIIIGLVLIFRNQISDIVTTAFQSITGDTKGIETEITIP